MSEKELSRLKGMGMLEQKQVTQRMVAEQLCINTRQIKRSWHAYQEQRAEGLIHKSLG